MFSGPRLILSQTSNPRAARNGNRLESTFLRVQVGITASLFHAYECVV
jgi:hypothetical protein